MADRDARVRLSEVNPHLICALCGGYFVDATTICDCLHSFCRSCIVRHLETSRFCPICEVQLHKSRPLQNIRPDKLLQRLVYKSVPGLFQDELKRRKQFYSNPDLQNSPRAHGDVRRDLCNMEHYHYSAEDLISMSIEYHDSMKGEIKKSEDKAAGFTHTRRYLQCPGTFPMECLKKFLRMKYGLTNNSKVDIYYQNKIIPDSFSLIDVAFTFNWDRESPMRFGYQLLERHAVVVNNATRVMITESSPSSSLEETAASVRNCKNPEGTRSEQPGQKRDLALGKKKPRENTIDEAPVPCKKARAAEDLPNKKSLENEVNCLDKDSSKSSQSAQEVVESVVIDDSSDTVYSLKDQKNGENQTTSFEDTKALAVDINGEEDTMDMENTSQAEEIMGADASQDIEEVDVDIEGEPSQDFILQDEQALDNSEDLEDDDEDRLRICDPEEISEEKNNDEIIEENTEAEPVQQDVEEKSESYVEEETEIIRKEGKSRRKNKKAKHHHRHKRDYSPAPEATIVSGDKNDLLKLKVKLTRPDTDMNGKIKNKDDGSKHHRMGEGHISPRQTKHKNYTIVEDVDTNTIQSPAHSVNDEDSRNSQSTDDHDARSVSSSKEGQDDLSPSSKGSPSQNGSMQQLSTKEKLLQMRQVRHKNITPTPLRAPMNTTISKVTAEEANKNTQKSPVLLTSATSSLTVSKVTAEERLKMMNNNNLESKRPSLEIIMVNKPNPNVNCDGKQTESQIKQQILSGALSSPVVKLTKTNNINALLQKQNSLSIGLSKSRHNSDGSRKVGEVSDKTKEVKMNSDKSRTGEKKGESFGVLDLSGKSTRSSDSSPNSESSCPSPNHTSTSLSQPLINRHLSSTNNPHRSSSNSPPVLASLSKGSPTSLQGLQHPSSSMWNLMTLSDTAVHIRNLKSCQAQEGIKRQMMNNQKKPSPQRYPSMSSPARTPSPRASPTHLKIPNPNFIGRPKATPTNPGTLPNVRPVSINRSLQAMSTRPTAAPSTRPTMSMPKMTQSQSIAIAKKRAEMNGRNPNIPPPPPAIPISTLYKMESMARKYDLEKMARGLSAANKAAAPSIPSS